MKGLRAGRMGWVLAAVLLAAPGAGAAFADPPPAGWERLDVPSTGAYLWRYVPASLDRTAPAPAILFLHGAGSTPEAYKSFVAGAAETAGAVLILPKSTGSSWGSAADETTLTEATALVQAELPLDTARLALAGHSAGGAFAYLVAYGSSIYSSVFTLSAPYYLVATLADPGYKPPLHMYYGTTDPNYTGGAYAALKAQWDRLGVAWEEDVQAGFGHNSWPNASMRAGFQFLVAHARRSTAGPCVPAPGTLCLRGGRFRVEVSWDTGVSQGQGTAVATSSDGSGLFWFFSPDNWELMVKVIDGCALNGHYWVFSAATTDVRYRLTVTDMTTGQAAVYASAGGSAAPAVTDTTALLSCP